MYIKGGVRITTKEIAKLAGVSPTAVSFVLNGKPGVSQQTREKVTALLLQHGFTIKSPKEPEPNQRIIHFIRYCDTGDLAERNDDFITQVMDGAESVLRQEQFILSISNAKNDNLKDVLSESTYESTAGILFLGTDFNPSRYPMLSRLQVPVVALDNCFRTHPINAVDIDNIGGAQGVIHYLFQQGHRKIGYLKSTFHTESLRERSIGFHYGMETAGLNLFSTVTLSPRVTSADEEMSAYLDSKPALPTAFFADNDIIAVGAMRALLRKGIRVPEDISLIGFDDAQIASMVFPSLTTMCVQKREMGICAARRLLELIENPEDTITKTSVNVRLIPRETVAAPRLSEFIWPD